MFRKNPHTFLQSACAKIKIKLNYINNYVNYYSYYNYIAKIKKFNLPLCKFYIYKICILWACLKCYFKSRGEICLQNGFFPPAAYFAKIKKLKVKFNYANNYIHYIIIFN